MGIFLKGIWIRIQKTPIFIYNIIILYLRRAKKLGFTLNVYFPFKDKETVEIYDTMVKEGLDYLITNDPELALKYVTVWS